MNHTIVSTSPDENRFLVVLKDSNGKQTAMTVTLEVLEHKVAAIIRVNGKIFWATDKIVEPPPMNNGGLFYNKNVLSSKRGVKLKFSAFTKLFFIN